MQIGQTVLMREKAPVEGAFFLGDSLAAWLSKKQGSISLSTIEAEYIVAATCCTYVLWMIQTLADLEVNYIALIPIRCDNTSAISVSKNLVFHSKTKHIPIKYHFLRERVTNQIFQVGILLGGVVYCLNKCLTGSVCLSLMASTTVKMAGSECASMDKQEQRKLRRN
jgi:hypothetical protein